MEIGKRDICCYLAVGGGDVRFVRVQTKREIEMGSMLACGRTHITSRSSRISCSMQQQNQQQRYILQQQPTT